MRAAARAQPNIALIKYWGKRDTEQNLPAVGSISITLADLYTTMRVAFDAALGADTLVVNDAASAAMLPRVSRCLDAVAGADRPRAAVSSEGNFPIAAGLASSASAFAALVVAADAAAGKNHSREQLASLAGRASGSAARSIHGGFVELASGDDAIALTTLCKAGAWPKNVVV
ncbi:MAG: diphosphomevalonate decarboxylase, partial [Woeseiaceae bacterium]|nr:diphosphomevalonate decarboxylase [Woeseiaceae bacterium]